MAGVTANGGIAVLGAVVTIKRTGFWSAELDIDSDDKLTGAITFTDGVSEGFVGTIIRPPDEPYSGRLKVFVQGGAGKLGVEVPARPYKSTSVRRVLLDLLELTGDPLSLTSDRTVLDTQLRFWHRARGPAQTAIKALIEDHCGANWRVRRDGSIWVGTDQFQESKPEHEIVNRDDVQAVIHIAPESFALDVGVSFQGKPVHELIYRLGEKKLRAEVHTSPDPLPAMIRRVVQQELREILYARTFPSIASKVDGSGNAAVVPDHSAIPDPDDNEHPMQPSGQTAVPVRLGMPGVRLEIGKPERCLVGFEQASPARPYVAGFQKGGTKARIGSLLIVQNPSSQLLVSVEFFPAGATGNALAEAARVAAALATNVPFLVPIDFEIWETR